MKNQMFRKQSIENQLKKQQQVDSEKQFRHYYLRHFAFKKIGYFKK